MPGGAFAVFGSSIRSVRNLALRQLRCPIEVQRFTFEVTRQCNGRCVYCNIWKTEKVDCELGTQELKDGLKPDRLIQSVRQIQLTGGEPFLRRDLVDVCSVLKEVCSNASFTLTTNGLLPDSIAEKVKEIREIDEGVQVVVSIDGFESVDAFQRGNPKHYDLAWETAELLRMQGLKTVIFSVVTCLSVDTTLKFKHFCEKRGFSHDIIVPNLSEHYYGNSDDQRIKDLGIPESKYPLLKLICKDGYWFQFYLPRYMEEKRQIFPCFSSFNSFFLSSTGTIYPCIHQNRPLGNIRQQELGDFWNNENAKGIRNDIVKGSCHCFTQCEAYCWIQANIFPKIREVLERKITNI